MNRRSILSIFAILPFGIGAAKAKPTLQSTWDLEAVHAEIDAIQAELPKYAPPYGSPAEVFIDSYLGRMHLLERLHEIDDLLADASNRCGKLVGACIFPKIYRQFDLGDREKCQALRRETVSELCERDGIILRATKISVHK